MTGQKDTILLAAAAVSSELREVRRIAREMSLGVMNAKAISHRAGDTARGFRPITDFIDEMAHEIIALVGRISQQSVSFSNLAVHHRHLRQTRERYRQVIEQGNAVRYIASLRQVMDKLDEEMERCRKEFIRMTRQLRALLEDIQRSTRGAQIISATSRVEASRAEGFSQSLEVVANQVDTSTMNIRARLQSSLDCLSGVLGRLAREES